MRTALVALAALALCGCVSEAQPAPTRPPTPTASLDSPRAREACIEAYVRQDRAVHGGDSDRVPPECLGRFDEATLIVLNLAGLRRYYGELAARGEPTE